MIIKYIPSKRKHYNNCWCNKCFKRKATKEELIKGDYFEYIKSPYWTKRKEMYYSKYPKVCKACGNKNNVQLHHIIYGNFGQEYDWQLVPLCDLCHKEFHSKNHTKQNMKSDTENFIKQKQQKIKEIIATLRT